ncbi:sensor histidine kinase [Dactylosporangium fulvum]|uniref:histidine kinase n=1 Tax=Dactylosporangium fulvum TaxID=53359 RepID=A0ABY5VS25_9ACTN|nr:sensor histidine kinase [Dactylosporangium fulvum]UWP80568.1 sensor histidine kinase [Dactylosporangium fulvum]
MSAVERNLEADLPRVVDIGAALVVVGMFWALPTISAGGSQRGVIGACLALVTGVVMIARRRMPFGATVTAGVATLVGTVLGVCQDPMLATAWCLYPMAIERMSRTRLIAAVLVGLFAALALVSGVPEGAVRGRGQQFVVAVAALSVAWLLGMTVGKQLRSAQEAERARVQLAVARDVHDVVGHALGVIVAEAGVTLSLPDAREDELRATLAGVEGHARTALADVQSLVRSLRTDESRAAPGTAELPTLFAATRAAGVRVDASVGTGPIGEAVGTVVFRIVQEALSNVVRHAPGASCWVDVRREGDAVVVLIRDDGPAVPGGVVPGTGLGLDGMRERARSIGGTVRWDARPDGGFEVVARLPLAGAR